MTGSWPNIQLGEVLRRSEETVSLGADTEYREVTVRLWGKGVIQRGTVAGAEVAATRRYIVRAGQFILSRIDARNGALGLVPPELDGAIVTNDFPTFCLDETRLLPKYLGWMSRTAGFVEMCRRASEGTTNRIRLQESRFLSLEIPLPPLEEQCRTVERIEALAEQISQAGSLRTGVDDALDALWPAILHSTLCGEGNGFLSTCGDTAEHLLLRSSKRHGTFIPTVHNNAYPHRPKIINAGPGALPKDWIWTTLGSVLTRLVDCVNDTPDFSEVDTGLLGLKSTNVRPYKLDLRQRWYMSPADFDRWNRREKPIAGDVILTREAPMGNACLLPENVEVCLTQRLLLLRADEKTIEPALLLHFLNSPIFQDQVKDQCRGLTTPHIRVQDAPELLLPLPPREVQRAIVIYLRNLRAEVDELTALHTETGAALDTLLPAVLNRAFNGGL